MDLPNLTTLAITPSVPFDFDSTFHKPDHFTSGDNAWQPGLRWQTWLWEGHELGLKFQNQGSTEAPRLTVEVYSTQALPEATLESLVAEINFRYKLQLDLTGFYLALRN